jgi:hypothetical protein
MYVKQEWTNYGKRYNLDPFETYLNFNYNVFDVADTDSEQAKVLLAQLTTATTQVRRFILIAEREENKVDLPNIDHLY